MDEQLEAAIAILAAKITDDVKADDALKYTQAALNLAHVKERLASAQQLTA